MSADGFAPAPRGKYVVGFAGIGGVCHGYKLATGRAPDVAMNHWDIAIRVHRANHPTTTHFCEDIRVVRPSVALDGAACIGAHFSPDCTQFSIAKGGKPRDNMLRGLADVIVDPWAKEARPPVITVENVREFLKWGPLDDNNEPIAEREGESFRAWVQALRDLRYVVDWRVLDCADYGAPTRRKRLFIVARCDGKPIVWPTPTHGPGRAHAWRTAAECIDFSIPSLSIFATKADAIEFGKRYGCGTPKRPLSPKTLARIARGIIRFVLNNPRPFVVAVRHSDTRLHDLGAPFPTILASDRELALVSPTLVQSGQGERVGQAPRALDITAPLGTVVGCGARHALVEALLAPHLAENYGERDGGFVGGKQITLPMSTVTAVDHHSLVTSSLVRLQGTSRGGEPVDRPLGGVSAQGFHFAETRALLVKYYETGGGADLFDPMPTATSHDRFGLVTVDGRDYAIADIGFRMLTPRECARAQGFPDDYALEVDADGNAVSLRDQQRLVGNAVPPQAAAALLAANLGGAP